MSDDITEFTKKEKISSNVVSFPSSKKDENVINISTEKEKLYEEIIKRQNMGMSHTFIHVRDIATFIGTLPDSQGNKTFALAVGPSHIKWENNKK